MAEAEEVDIYGVPIPASELDAGAEMTLDLGAAEDRTVYIDAHMMLESVIKVLRGSAPKYQHHTADGLYFATGFVVVPLQGNEFTTLEATGVSTMTREGAEQAAAFALIDTARRDFGVVVHDVNCGAVATLEKEKEQLLKINKALRSGWSQALGYVEKLKKTCEEISLDAFQQCPISTIDCLADSAAVWADEVLLEATGALHDLSI